MPSVIYISEALVTQEHIKFGDLKEYENSLNL